MIKIKLLLAIFLLVSANEISNSQTPKMRIVTYDALSKITYDVSRYGNKSWFKDDLKSFKLIGNITIPQIADARQSDTISYPAYFIRDNKFYYNWYTVENQKICPNQWRVPGLSDFLRLVDIVNADSSGLMASPSPFLPFFLSSFLPFSSSPLLPFSYCLLRIII
jgi:hypothetical protein